MPTMPVNYYNRFDPSKEYDEHLFVAGPVLQSAELNEIQSNLIDKVKGLGDALFADGHIVSGASVSINGAGLITANLGEVYAAGAVRAIPATTFSVATTGTVSIGIRIYQTVVTSADDAALLNPVHTGTHYLDPGAARLKSHATWGWSGDGNPGDFYAVHTVIDGVVQAPPALVQLATAGAHTVTVPAGCKLADIQLWGAGGGGALGSAANSGEGGGGGAYCRSVLTVAPGTVLSITVGAGGSPYIGASGPAGNGGDTAITIGATTLTAGGGGGAILSSSSGGTGGAGGVATGGQVNASGQPGVNGSDYQISSLDYIAVLGTGGAAAFGGAGSHCGVLNPQANTLVNGMWPGGGGGGGRGNTPSAGAVSYGADGGAVIHFS